MLTKETIITEITAHELGNIHVRVTTRIYDDETEISSSHHRYVLSPGDDISNQPAKVQAIAHAAWTNL